MEILLREIQNDRDTVLITIIAKVGSAPRGCGAQMLVGPSGLLAGTVGGGAIEGRAIQLSCRLLEEKRSCREVFSLGDAAGQDLKMACGGGVELMFNYVNHEDAVWKQTAEAVIRSLEMNIPGNLLLRTDGVPVLEPGKPRTMYGGELREAIYVYPLPMKQRLILCGGGHVAQALAPILVSVDFRVIVLENRPEFADPLLFPGVDQVICGDYSKLTESVDLQPEDFVVIMTHGHLHDQILLEQLLRKDYAYIGLMGSKRKIAAVTAHLQAVGICPEKMEKVHTPIGLKIGAVTPEEIAVSVAAECIAVRNALRNAQSSSCPSTL